MKYVSWLLIAACVVLEIVAYVRLQLFLTKSAEDTVEDTAKELLRRIGLMFLPPLLTALIVTLLQHIG